MTWTNTILNILDAAGVSHPVIAYTDGTNYSFAHPLLDNTGAIIAPATSGNQATMITALGLLSTSALQTAANTSLAAIATSVAANATAAAQTTGNTSLATIATNTTGAATAALQTTGNTTLSSMLTALQAATPAGSNNIGSVNTAANTAGGTSTYAALGGTGNALLTNTPVAVKSSAGNLYGVSFVNTGNAAAYVQLFDVAQGSVTLGTTVPKLSFYIPANGSWEEKFPDEAKISFSTAITAAAATTSTGNTAPSTGILANIIYK